MALKGQWSWWGVKAFLRMNGWSRLLSTLVLLLAIGTLFPATACAEPSVIGARIGKHPGTTRFVLDLSAAVEFKLFTLNAPYRVVIDLPRVRWDIQEGGLDQGGGLIKRYRFGHFTPETSRVVLDLEAPVGIKEAFILPPEGDAGHRLVVDLEPVGEAEFLERLKSASPPPAPSEATTFGTVQQAPFGKRVVVIDPGHGGIDPGAVGASGIYEKDVTLAAGLKLKEILEATGRYSVVMTRERDVFVPLRERVAVGRNAGGELFISLHADLIRDPNIRGASVYTLSEKASDQETAELAARENKSDVIAGVDLSDQYDEEVAAILITLTQRETMNCSAIFAWLLVPELAKNGKVVRNSHRSAGFRVLKAPDMPSILVELGYLSNAQDKAILESGRGRAELMESLARTVDRYFEKRNCWS